MLSLTNILINVPIALIAITGHELAHAWVSSRLGDPTPRYEGRLTLNPLAHLDPIGTLLMIFTGFGWAKPVGVNPMYYKDRKKGMALVALAGPVSNFLMAFVGILIAVILMVIGERLNWSSGVISTIFSIADLFCFRNLCLMVFNLIPIPPLDGSKILGMFLPNRTYYNILQYERYAIYLIMFLSLTGTFNTIIGSGVNVFYSAIIRAVSSLVSLIV
ncbi:MAG: site-2 protease family protein [Clostridia bacterium]|nr:site-2 protease family protein [Clostridia bacterium]